MNYVEVWSSSASKQINYRSFKNKILFYYAGFDDVLELLVIHGADINAVQKNGTTPLMHACEQVGSTVELVFFTRI